MSWLDQIGQQAVTRLQNNIRNVDYSGLGPANNTGKLADSVRYEATYARVTVYAESYIFNASEGRKAGKYPPYNPNDTRYGFKTRGENKGKPRGTFPNIADWIETKKSANTRFKFADKSDSEKAGVVWSIAKGIAENGTIISQKGGSNMLSSVINEAFTEAIKNEVLGTLTLEFKSILSGKS